MQSQRTGIIIVVPLDLGAATNLTGGSFQIPPADSIAHSEMSGMLLGVGFAIASLPARVVSDPAAPIVVPLSALVSIERGSGCGATGRTVAAPASTNLRLDRLECLTAVGADGGNPFPPSRIELSSYHFHPRRRSTSTLRMGRRDVKAEALKGVLDNRTRRAAQKRNAGAAPEPDRDLGSYKPPSCTYRLMDQPGGRYGRKTAICRATGPGRLRWGNHRSAILSPMSGFPTSKAGAKPRAAHRLAGDCGLAQR